MASFTLVYYCPSSPFPFIPDPSLAYLASVLKAAGHQCEVFNYNPLTWGSGKLLNHVGKKRPEAIGFKVVSQRDLKPTIDLAKAAKKASPSSFIVAGGPLITLGQEEVFKVTDAFDALVTGEGEAALLELSEYLEGKRRLEDVRNIVFRKGEDVVKTEVKLIENLDELPFPDWGVFDLENYFPVLSLTMSRGCPYRCAYCCANYLWGYRVRRRSLLSITMELDLMTAKYGCSSFYITDPTPDPGLLEGLSDYIYQNDLPLRWFSYGNVSTFKPSLFPKLARGGCRCLIFGIESGDPAMLKRMCRGYLPDKIAPLLRAAKECGIKVLCSFIVGFPGESKASLEKSLKLLSELSPDDWVVEPFTLQPHTPVARRPREYGIQLQPNWVKKFLLGEGNYYAINGVPSDLWLTFWDRKWRRMASSFQLNWGRLCASTPWLSLLAPLIEMQEEELYRLLQQAQSSGAPDLEAIKDLIARCWRSSASLIKKASTT
ncbi:MAG: B12-binding domain-containing radical SAM protein [Candidatus Nezhaarchaeota archaeon]|nr:B12-binding domain-containing radical SAM protein [Candidatus Nezhaarchaeota archaeon]